MCLTILSVCAAETVTPEMVTQAKKDIFSNKTSEEEKSAALQLLKKGADESLAEAEYWYAWMRFYGKGGLPSDKKEAYRYFCAAAEKNHPLGLFWVGFYHAKGFIFDKDPVKAFEYLKKSADTGRTDIMHRFAMECFSGQNFPADLKTGIRYLERAAEKNHAPSVYQLGRCYFRGRGVKRDRKMAFSLYCRAADLGYAEAQYQAAMSSFFRRGTRRNQDLEFKYFSKAAAQGHVLAIYRTGNCYYFGFGVKQDFKKALQFFHHAALKGNPDSMTQIGYCYFRGFGVPQNLPESVKWYERAAEKKDESAYLQLARCYYSGVGVKKDLKKSWYYFDLIEKGQNETMKRIIASEIAVFYEKGVVVEQNDEMAFYYNNRAWTNAGRIKAGIALMTGKGTPVSFAAALEKFNAAVKNSSSPLGAFFAGSLYISGRNGVPLDVVKAEQLLTLSAEAGYVPAMKLLAKLYKDGTQNFPMNHTLSRKWANAAQRAPVKNNEDFIGSPHR